MNVSLKPDLQKFVDEQVNAGHFPSPEAVVEAALAEMREFQAEPLDRNTIAAINRADEQADRGEGMELDAFRAQMNKRVGGR
jgi:Arc/MetJ-type ribon-helix-helix transcriptional regulator